MSELDSNICQIKVNEMVDIFSQMYRYQSPKYVPSQMLWGSPGVGKSKGIYAFAKRLEELTGKKVVVTDVRLLLFNPVDLRGIPVASDDKKFAIWLKPYIFQMDESKDIINILLLDEISAAPLSVQASAYQITLDRVIGEHRLPENCIVMAAGNKVTDKSVAYKMPKALAGRMTHYEIVPDIDDWKKWAYPEGIDARILGWLNYEPSNLFKFNPNDDNNAYPTPRSWEMVDKYLKIFKDFDSAFMSMSGSIGKGAVTAFKGYIQVFDKLPNIKDIFDGKNKDRLPQDPALLFAISAALASYTPKVTKDEQIKNIIIYFKDVLPVEFVSLTIRDMCSMKDVKQRFLDCPEWVNWCQGNKEFIL